MSAVGSMIAVPTLARRMGLWLATRGVRTGLIVCFALALFVAPAFAANDNDVIVPRSAARGDAPAASTAGSLNSMSLLLGLALAGVGGWMVWRHRRGTPVGRDMRALSVDETRSLGNRQYLVVASYEGKKFLLGVCPGRIEMLSPLDGSSVGTATSKSRE